MLSSSLLQDSLNGRTCLVADSALYDVTRKVDISLCVQEEGVLLLEIEGEALSVTVDSIDVHILLN